MPKKKNTSKQKTYDKVFHVIENRLIFLVLLIFISYTLLTFLLDFNNNYQDFIETTVNKALHDLKSSLLSIAAIFIGIYVTVFTLLGSIRVDSIFAFLNEYTFKKLIKFIRNAFIASFSYLILIMVLEIVYSKYYYIEYPWIILNASIVIYMFLTALRFGIILYVSFSKDLQNLQKNIKDHRQEKKEVEQLQHRLNNFLDEYEARERQKENDRMSEIIKSEHDE